MERLTKDVKRRLRDFDISFPRSRGLPGVRLWSVENFYAIYLV